jgi:hypothetical protein
MSQADAPKPEIVSHVTLRFNRKLTAAEIEQLKQTADAVEALEGDGHHDHDHPSIQ